MALKCIENTPSVYFQFDDTANKTNLSGQYLFELSCTNDKHHYQPIRIVDHNLLDLTQNIDKPPTQKLKTEEFFIEFDSNFVVTFEQNINGTCFNNTAPQTSPLHIPQENPEGTQSINNEPNEINTNETENQDIENITISLEQNSKLTNKNQEFKERLGLLQWQLEKQKESELQKQKQRGSPIPAFEVKKRTVFKNKENILNNAQQFKITKKKIINQNTLQIFACHPNTCKIQPKYLQNNPPLLLTSKMSLQQKQKQTVKSIIQTKIITVDRKYKSTIFQADLKPHRQTLRSTTLDNWKRKFNKHKKSLQEKTIKRTHNIFQKPFSII